MDEKFVLAGNLFMAAIVLYKLVRQMTSCRSFTPLKFSPSDTSMSESVPELPDDILIEILVRLPVSSILLLRSVSRSFHTLVLECHTCNRLPPILVGILCVGSHRKCPKYINILRGFGYSSVDYNPLEFLIEASLRSEIIDCKFGIILCRSWVSNVIYLCNPTTKRIRSIPFEGSYYNFILAFDPSWSKHHYEIIKISENYKDGGGYIFEVFSSKLGRWGQNFLITEYYIDLCMHGSCFVNGILYMFESCYFDLIAINCADGSYKRVNLPTYGIEYGRQFGELCNLCGCLMYSQFYRGELSVWALSKNKNESCWLLRHRIYLKDRLKKIGFSFPFDNQHGRCYGCIIELFYLDTIIVRINDKIFLYNIESDHLQVCTCEVYGIPFPWSPCYYALAGL